MKNILINALSQKGYIMTSKALINYFKDLNTASVLSFIVDKWAYFKCNDFYYTLENLMQDTYLTERALRLIIKKLVDEDLLIKKGFKGVPAKQFYNINHQKILDILNTDLFLNDDNSSPCNFDTPSPNTIKSVTPSPCNFDRARDLKSDRAIYSNNKYNNNTENNNKEKKQTKKDLKSQALSLFDEYKSQIIFLTREKWSEWIDYKFEVCKCKTLKSVTKELKDLISFNELASLSIDTAIKNEWKSVYKPTQNKKAVKNDFDYSLWHETRDTDILNYFDFGKNDENELNAKTSENNAKEQKQRESINDDDILPFWGI